MNRIPLLVPELPSADALRPYLERIDAARWYTNFGPLVLELERALPHFVRGKSGRMPSVTTVANCTLGLELALQALKLKPGARVLVPGLTFVASAAAIVRAGGVPVIGDVDAASWLLTPQIARRALEEVPCDAVMPVATFGCAQDAPEWDAFSLATGLPVLLDAAGAFGNQHAGDRVALVYSLHATKSLGAGEGGFVVSGDAPFIEHVRRLSNFGIEISGGGTGTGPVSEAGTNAKLSEYHAAVALASLEGWAARAARRIELHRVYERMLLQCAEVTLQRRAADGVYSILPVLLPEGCAAEAVAMSLRANGIETRRWYCPTIERHPAFAAAPRAGALEALERLNQRLLGLPFHASLGEEQVLRVCRSLAAALHPARFTAHS